MKLKKVFMSTFSVSVLVGALIIGASNSYADTALQSPQNVTVSMNNSESSAMVSWEAPANASNFQNLEYIVTESPDGQEFTTTNTSQTFENLSIGQHSFMVKARGTDEDGPTETVIQNFSYTGTQQSFTTPYSGEYKLEVWGAQGGQGSYVSGKGGYSKGNINLLQNEELYLYVGGAGLVASSNSGWVYTNGGWNGGGGTRSYNSSVGSGGGATDISLSSSKVTLDSFQRYIRSDSSYLSRIIVAGGGGGNGRHEVSLPPTSGGGLLGIGTNKSQGVINQRTVNVDAGGAGTQNSGGNAELYPNPDYDTYRNYSAPGSLGKGGTYYSANQNNTAAGGGGGGWYGGGVNSHGPGGGGSGYVLTSTSYKPSGYIPDSRYWMTDTQTIDGNQTFKSPTGSNEVGHSGNGYARITFQGIPSVESNSVSVNGEIFAANLNIHEINQINTNVTVSWNIDSNYENVSYKVSDDVSGQEYSTTNNSYIFENLSRGLHTFTVKAFNSNNEQIAENTSEFVVNSRPSNLSIEVSQIGNNQAKINWSVGDDGGSPINKFNLIVDNSNPINIDSQESSKIINVSTGDHEIKLSAVNEIGESDYVTSSITIKPLPSQVRNLQIVKSSKTVTVSWTPPKSYINGASGQGFMSSRSAFVTEGESDEGIEYIVESIPAGYSQTTSGTSVTFDLDEGDDTDYQFKVTPVMPFGEGIPNYTGLMSNSNNMGEVNIFVESSITLTLDDNAVDLSGIPGTTNVVTDDNEMNYTVTTNNLEGYTVTVKADNDTLNSSIVGNNDNISVNLITVAQPDSQNGTGSSETPLSSTNDNELYSQNQRSIESGDTFISTFNLTEVPWVNADDYTGTITYTATAN